MVDSAYFVKSTPLGAFTGSFQHLAVTLQTYWRYAWRSLMLKKYFLTNLLLIVHTLWNQLLLELSLDLFSTLQICYVHIQDQDQDSLLVKRRNDNHSPGPVIRELVPSSHQRSELSNTILCIFGGWDQRIEEGIPIPDSLGEEATFINICIGNGSLKCHRVLIPTTPSFGDKVICWYTGFTFKTFI